MHLSILSTYTIFVRHIEVYLYMYITTYIFIFYISIDFTLIYLSINQINLCFFKYRKYILIDCTKQVEGNLRKLAKSTQQIFLKAILESKNIKFGFLFGLYLSKIILYYVSVS